MWVRRLKWGHLTSENYAVNAVFGAVDGGFGLGKVYLRQQALFKDRGFIF